MRDRWLSRLLVLSLWGLVCVTSASPSDVALSGETTNGDEYIGTVRLLPEDQLPEDADIEYFQGRAEVEEGILRSNAHWFVFLHHQTCSQCIKLLPDFERVARRVDGPLKFAVADVTADLKWALDTWSLKGLPALGLYFEGRKHAPVFLPGWRSETEPKSSQIIFFVMEVLKELFPQEDAEPYRASVKSSQTYSSQKDKPADFYDDDPEMAEFGAHGDEL